jgi:glutathione peroxidase
VFYEFEVTTIDGRRQRLDEVRGQVVLVVNVASRCGYTRQYQGLQQLHEQFEGRGLRILGFPCNQFGAQEPGTDAEIQTFACDTYGVGFPMFSKIDVNGPDRHPLYAWLTSQDTAPTGPGDVAWNFEKFLIDREGRVVGRYASRVTPADLAPAVEKLL